MGACAPPDPADGGSDGSLWWLGVLMSIFASIASNLGVNVQKFSLMKEVDRLKKRPYVAQPLWVLGLLLVVGGSIGDFAALGFAAQSLITPVGGFTMVANVFFAHFWLKEELSKKDLIGTGAVIVGVILIAAFADKSESCFSLGELMGLYAEVSFFIYAGIVVSISLGLYIFVKYIEKVHRTVGGRHPKYKKLLPFHQFIYPTLSGMLGAQSVLFAKSTAELVKAGFRGEDAFKKPMTYVIILFMFATIFMQLHWLAVALTWFDAVYCIPVFQCFFITVTIFGGATYFQELNRFSELQMIMFPLGVIVTLGGIVLLSQRDMGDAEELEAEAEEELELVEQTPSKTRVGGEAVRFMVRTQISAKVPISSHTSPTKDMSTEAMTPSHGVTVPIHTPGREDPLHKDLRRIDSKKIKLPPLRIHTSSPKARTAGDDDDEADAKRLSSATSSPDRSSPLGSRRSFGGSRRSTGRHSRSNSQASQRETPHAMPMPMGVSLAEGLGTMFTYFAPTTKRFFPNFHKTHMSRRHSAVGFGQEMQRVHPHSYTTAENPHPGKPVYAMLAHNRERGMTAPVLNIRDLDSTQRVSRTPPDLLSRSAMSAQPAASATLPAAAAGRGAGAGASPMRHFASAEDVRGRTRHDRSVSIDVHSERHNRTALKHPTSPAPSPGRVMQSLPVQQSAPLPNSIASTQNVLAAADGASPSPSQHRRRADEASDDDDSDASTVHEV